MVQVLIERSDGRAQLYNVKRGWIAKHPSSIKLVDWHGTRRRRKVYSSSVEIECQKSGELSKHNQIGGVFYEIERELTNKIEISSRSPIPGYANQLRVKLKAWKGTTCINVEGKSFLHHPGTSFGQDEAMKRSAYAAAYAQIPFSPDSVQVIYMDYVAFIDKPK